MSLRVDNASGSGFARELKGLSSTMGLPPNFDSLLPKHKTDRPSRLDCGPSTLEYYLRLADGVNPHRSVCALSDSLRPE